MTTEHRKNQGQGASSSRLPTTPPDPILGMPLDVLPKHPDQNQDRSRGRSANNLVGKDLGPGPEKVRSTPPEQSQNSIGTCNLDDLQNGTKDKIVWWKETKGTNS